MNQSPTLNLFIYIYIYICISYICIHIYMYGGPRLITCHDIKEVSINARILTLFKQLCWLTLVLNSMQCHLAYPSTYKIRLNTHTCSHTIISPLVLGLFIIQKKGARNLPTSSFFQRSVLFILCVRAKSVSLLKSLVVIQLPVTLTLFWNCSHSPKSPVISQCNIRWFPFSTRASLPLF